MTRTLVGILELFGLGIWVGTILFFSLVVAPTAFRALDSAHAGTYIRAVFPRYYFFGMVLGLLVLGLGVVYRGLSKEWGALSLLTLALTGVMVATTAYAHFALRPQIEAHREARENVAEGTPDYNNANEQFKRGHLLSVVLNLLVLVVGILLFIVLPLSRRM